MIVASYHNGGPRFVPINEKLPWQNASAKCQSLGGALATITSKEENDIVQYLTHWAYCDDG